MAVGPSEATFVCAAVAVEATSRSVPQIADGVSALLALAAKPVAAGAATGALECFVTYPTEYVKTHLQLQPKQSPHYNGIVDCVKKTVARHGPLGLYRGMSPLLAGSIPKQASRWATYEICVTSCTTRNAASGAAVPTLSTAQVVMCGFTAGIVEALVAVVPTETVKTRLIEDLRSERPQLQHLSLGRSVMHLIRAEGVQAVYRGVGNTALKQGLNQAVRFPLQHAAMSAFARDASTQYRRKSPLWNGAAGFVAGVLSVLITQPLDVVKTRLQSSGAEQYGTTLECWLHIARREGLRAFYAGCTPRMVRVGGNVGLTFTLFPLIRALM